MGRAPFFRIIPWHLPYNWRKCTINLSQWVSILRWVVSLGNTYWLKPVLQVTGLCIMQYAVRLRSCHNKLQTSWILGVASIKLLKPSGFFTYHQVQHSKILHGACFALSVFLWISKQTSTIALYVINWLAFITVVESVYSAVRIDSSYKSDYVWPLNDNSAEWTKVSNEEHVNTFEAKCKKRKIRKYWRFVIRPFKKCK